MRLPTEPPDSAAAAMPMPAAPGRSAAYLWYVVGFLTLAATISYIDRQIVALMVGPLKRDLGMSDTQIGLVVGLAFAVPYSAMLIPMAWLADTRSRRAVIGAGIFLWSLMSAASAFARDYTHLFVARMGVGVGEATLSPSAYSLLSDYFSKDRLPIAVGVFSTAPFIGIGLANMLGGPLVQYLEAVPAVELPLIGQARSWQLAFLIVGIPGLLFALLTLTVAEPVRRGLLAAGNTAERVPWKVILRFVLDRRAFFALHFCGLVSMAIQAWMLFAWVAEFFIRQHGMLRGEIGTIYGLIALTAGITGSITAGRIATVMVRRGAVDATLRLVGISALAMAPLAIAMPLVADRATALALLTVITFFMAWPPGLAIVALQVITPNEFRGRIIAGSLVLTNFLSFTLGPLLVGFFNDSVFHSEAAIGRTLATLASVSYPVAALSFFYCLRHFRAALRISHAWD
jgi:predicted MFS family arabinose efflux permease